MTPAEYMEKVREFSDYPRLDWPLYPMVLLAEEAEELYSAIEEGKDIDAILRECGDCLWAIVAISIELGLNELNESSWKYMAPKIDDQLTGTRPLDEVFRFMRITSRLLGKAHKAMRGDKNAFIDMSSTFVWFCGEVGFVRIVNRFGATLEDVAILNIRKLEDRRARKTLQGNGDYR